MGMNKTCGTLQNRVETLVPLMQPSVATAAVTQG
jgi:hypothetical protein